MGMGHQSSEDLMEGPGVMGVGHQSSEDLTEVQE